jgi:type I restriction enzyme, S subunit
MPERGFTAGWRRVAFGDVVRQVRDRVDPGESGLDRYVAGEHMDTDDLRIRRWGSIGDAYLGPAFHMRFKPGHVLYGSRRTYLRKVAVADFEGITANTTFVLEPKDPHILLPELLPFIMQSEFFHEHSVKQSKGSVNPYINFSDLTWYEFALPPLEMQERIAAALGHATALADRYHTAARTLGDVTRRFLINEYARACRSSAMHKIGDVGDLKMGRQKAPKYSRGICPHPFLRVVNVGELELQLDDVEQMDFTAAELERFRLQPGDILLTEGDLIGAFNVGRPVLFGGEIEDCCFQNTLIRFRPSNRVSPEYSLLLFEGARLSHVFANAAKTTTVTHLGLGRLAEVRIPVPPRDEQREVAQTFAALLDARASFRKRVHGLARIRADLLNNLLK